MKVKTRPVWMQRIFDSYGGQDKFFDFFAAVKAQIDAIDESQIEATQNVGRVLHTHLMTECFLTRYLQNINPNHGPLKNALLCYSQKLDLISPSDSAVYFLMPGLRCLESIRNRLAHDPTVIVTDRDKRIFLGVPLFKAIRTRSLPQAGIDRQTEAMSVMECFATFAGIILCNASNPDKRLFTKSRNHQKAAISDSSRRQRKTATGKRYSSI